MKNIHFVYGEQHEKQQQQQQHSIPTPKQESIKNQSFETEMTHIEGGDKWKWNYRRQPKPQMT